MVLQRSIQNFENIIKKNGFLCVDDFLKKENEISSEDIENWLEEHKDEYTKETVKGTNNKTYIKLNGILLKKLENMEDFTKNFLEGISEVTSLSTLAQEHRKQKRDNINGITYIDMASKEFEYEIQKNRENIYYRGHSSTYYTLMPSIYREEAWIKYESNLYHDLISNSPNEFRDIKRHLDALQIMQHYSLPTRLLDITHNPLIALYFVISENFDEDGELIVFDIDEKIQRNMFSDSVEIQCALAALTKETKIALQEDALKSKEKLEKAGKNKDDIIRDFNNKKSTKRLLHQIRILVGSFEEYINPNDLFGIKFVKTLKDNDRIARQDGNFIVTGLYTNEDEVAENINRERYCSPHRLERFIIPSSSKENLLKSLAIMGIHKASIYPEINNVADYLKNKYRYF